MNHRALALRVPVADIEVQASPCCINVVAHHVVCELQRVKDARAEDCSPSSLPLTHAYRKGVERLPDRHRLSGGSEMQDQQGAHENCQRDCHPGPLIHVVSQARRPLRSRITLWTPRKQSRARPKTSQPDKKWKNPSAYSTPNHRPMRPVITMRPAFETIAMGRTAATRTNCIQNLGSMRYAQAVPRATKVISDRIPLQASVTPSVMRLRWMTLPSSKIGTPRRSSAQAPVSAAMFWSLAVVA